MTRPVVRQRIQHVRAGPNFLLHLMGYDGLSSLHPEPIMATPWQVRLPKQCPSTSSRVFCTQSRWPVSFCRMPVAAPPAGVGFVPNSSRRRPRARSFRKSLASRIAAGKDRDPGVGRIYTPAQRMRILQLRAARGWTLEKTARLFLLDLQTLLIWMRRLDEQGERALIQTVEPVKSLGRQDPPDLRRGPGASTRYRATPRRLIRVFASSSLSISQRVGVS